MSRAWGLAACILYVGLSALVGEVFPFSRFTMYAGLADRDHAAVFQFELDGQVVDPLELEAFSGFDTDALVPTGVATAQEHELAPIARHIDANPGPETGGRPLQLVWRVFRVEDGVLSEERVPGQQGLAW